MIPHARDGLVWEGNRGHRWRGSTAAIRKRAAHRCGHRLRGDGDRPCEPTSLRTSARSPVGFFETMSLPALVRSSVVVLGLRLPHALLAGGLAALGAAVLPPRLAAAALERPRTSLAGTKAKLVPTAIWAATHRSRADENSTPGPSRATMASRRCGPTAGRSGGCRVARLVCFASQPDPAQGAVELSAGIPGEDFTAAMGASLAATSRDGQGAPPRPRPTASRPRTRPDPRQHGRRRV